MREKFSKIFAVIVIIVMYVIKYILHPLSGAHITSFAASHHGIYNSCFLCSIMVSTKQEVFSSKFMQSFA
jgi:hypothetical protein